MNETQKEAYNSLYDAIEDGEFDVFMSLIDRHPELLQETSPLGTWLHIAAANGQLEMVKVLLKQGLRVNVRAGIGDGNALNDAASEGHYEVAKYLLDAGADMDVSEPERNPLFGAIQGGHLTIGKLLIDRGIDTKVSYTGKSMMNMDALAFAKENQQEEFIKLLEKIG